jgi:hypothetical protein
MDQQLALKGWFSLLGTVAGCFLALFGSCSYGLLLSMNKVLLVKGD